MFNNLLNIFKDNSNIEIRKLIHEECLKYIVFSDSIRLTHSSGRLDFQATLSISIGSFSNGLMPSTNA